MKNEIIQFTSPELDAVSKSRADEIKKTFDPMVKMLKGFEKRFNEVKKESKKEITEEICQKAKRLRLDISKVRIGTEKLKTEQKKNILIAGRAVDGVANILKYAVSEKEDALKEIETHFEKIENERVEKLQEERIELIGPYMEDAYSIDFSDMDEDVFQAYYSTKKRQYEEKIEAEKIAEQKRIDDENERIEKQKAIEAENKRLKKEREDERKERERLQKIADKKLEDERKERERLQKIISDKKIAEQKKIDDAEKLKQQNLKKADGSKFKDFISDLDSLKTKYSFKSAVNKKKYNDARILIDKVIKHLEK